MKVTQRVRMLLTATGATALLAGAGVVAAPAAVAGGDAGSGNQPQNTRACAAITQVAGHSPGAANGQAIGDLLVAFCPLDDEGSQGGA